ncbi:MAG: MFS transporter [Candidatus Hydrothermales bacterium]
MFNFKGDAVLFLSGSFLLGLGFSGFGLLFNLYLKEVGFSESKIGFILALMSYVAVIMMFPAAFIVRKINVKPIIIVSVIFSCFGYLISAVTNIYFHIILGVVMTGIFSSFLPVLSGPLMMQMSTEPIRMHLFSTGFTISLASGILGNILAGNLPLFF